MLVRVWSQGPEREVRARGVDLPAPTLVASGARSEFSRRGTGWVDVLVEPWEDAVTIKAQAGGNLNRIVDVTDRPIPTLMAFQPTDVYVEPDAFSSRRARRDGKPPYRVPTMDEIAAAEKCGRVVASTFSCAGGSTTGYRMAGFDVAAAVEIDAVPAESYRLNHPSARVLEKNVRDVTARELLRAAGAKKGELDLLDGSPPCTSFSAAGLRSKTWGKTRRHAGAEQRIDDLFLEFARLLDGAKPLAFVAENVRGLSTGAAIGYFKAILRALRKCGYVVAVQVLDADLLGVPQHRERIFFVGVRDDVAKKLGVTADTIHEDVFPKPLPHQYTVRDALPWLDPSSDAYALQGTPFGEPERIAAGTATPPERIKKADAAPAATVTTSQRAGVQVVHDTAGTGGRRETQLDGVPGTLTANAYAPSQWKVVETADGGTVYRRKFTILEVKRLCSFPDDYRLAGKFAQQWAQLGNSVPPLMMRAVAEGLRDRIFAEL